MPDRAASARTGRALLGQGLLWRVRNPPTPQCIEEHQGRHATKHACSGKIAEDGEGHDDYEPESSRDADRPVVLVGLD